MSRLSIPEVSFHFPFSAFTLRHRGRLKRFLLDQCDREGVAVESLTYVFLSDAGLLELNQGYLKHDTYTDIITFPLHAPGAPVIGEIYISAERVRDNALHFNEPFIRELHRVIFHGALHLCGYKDKSRAEAATMREKEEEWLSEYFVPRGTDEV